MAEALALAEQARPDLVLLEHGVTGAELVRLLREGEPGRSWDRDAPVIVPRQAVTRPRSTRARALDRRLPDDFVVRPFADEELLARIRGPCRRSATPAVAPDRDRRFPGPRPDHASCVGRRQARGARGQGVLAPPATLAAEPDRVFTKVELLRDVWGFQAQAPARARSTRTPSRVRRKLAHRQRRAPFVVNVWGVGYRLMDEPLHEPVHEDLPQAEFPSCSRGSHQAGVSPHANAATVSGRRVVRLHDRLRRVRGIR